MLYLIDPISILGVVLFSEQKCRVDDICTEFDGLVYNRIVRMCLRRKTLVRMFLNVIGFIVHLNCFYARSCSNRVGPNAVLLRPAV